MGGINYPNFCFVKIFYKKHLMGSFKIDKNYKQNPGLSCALTRQEMHKNTRDSK